MPYEIQNKQPFSRGVFANRTLNMRSLRAIGYDMDYTVVHYHVKAWEEVAFRFLKARLVDLGWPIEDAVFKEDFGMRGLIIDRHLGNIVKANRFGYIKKAVHAFESLPFDEQKRTYNQVVVDLSDRRWGFVNTYFSLSEICLFAHAVEAFDQGKFPRHMSYEEIASTIRQELDAAHIEGALKAVIAQNPEQFVDLDPDTSQALIDQREAGKKVLLITNSDWQFTNTIMSYSFNRDMPEGKDWTDLFDLVIVTARKPEFFTGTPPIYRVIEPDGLLQPVNAITDDHKIYHGGNAKLLEQYLGFSGDGICYVGDHIYSDVNVSKAMHRWRTCLISRELEPELEAIQAYADAQLQLDELMRQKDNIDSQAAQIRLSIQREKIEGRNTDTHYKKLAALRAETETLEAQITPLAIESSQLANPTWGLLMRTGNDKSLMARQLEQHADIYTSRVSNFLFATPFAYLRPTRGLLPHDVHSCLK